MVGHLLCQLVQQITRELHNIYIVGPDTQVQTCIAVYNPTMYNVYNNKLARWFTSYIEGLQVLISTNIAFFFIAEGIMSYANSRDPGEVPSSVAPHLGLHCSPYYICI